MLHPRLLILIAASTSALMLAAAPSHDALAQDDEEPLFLDEDEDGGDDDDEEPLFLDEDEDDEDDSEGGKDGEDPLVVDEDEDDDGALKTDTVDVYGDAIEGDITKKGGAAQRMDEEEIQRFKYTDPHEMLMKFTGLYVRQEDGYGLRPNIGLRGTSSDRSSKITLMEDGVLLAPAPYSAPAAYYFPIMSRMQSVEVVKGPASVLYGPNTIGGSVNLITREVPLDWTGMADVSSGMFANTRAHVYGGASNDWGGVVLEGVYLHSNGFKELDGGGDTGFDKGEVMLKGRLNSDPFGDGPYQSLTLKLGLSLERSHETYTGLSDSDFAANPDRRYRATSLDLMEWWRTQAEARYLVELSDRSELEIVGYRNDFSRAWEKFNGFNSTTSAADVLADPTSGRRRLFYDVLTGAADTASEEEILLIGTNDRQYVSQGLQGRLLWAPGGNRLEAGVRIHHDRIERLHTEDAYSMRAGELVRDDTDTVTTTSNIGTTIALAAWLKMEIALGDHITIAPGLRNEYITNLLENRLTGAESPDTYTVFVPGVSVLYNVFAGQKKRPDLAVFAGVHRGFSPVAPGQPEGTEPELSVSYELGARVTSKPHNLHAELTGFFNDYQNLTSQCSFSAGCAEALVDQQFNAGAVYVGGVEALAEYAIDLGSGVGLPLRLGYTYTGSSFQTAFDSEDPRLGEVEVGDSLPYIPEHQLTAEIGATWDTLSARFGFTFASAMREEASQGDEGRFTDPLALLDFTTSYGFLDGFEVYGRIDNILASRPIVSRRPFGARPGKPFSAIIGLKYHYE